MLLRFFRIATFSSLLVALIAGVSPAAVDYTLTNPANYDNPANNEYAPNAVEGVSTVGTGSWQANMNQPNLSQNWLYFQGDGTNHPQLLFDPNAGLTVNDIQSISWDTNKDKSVAADNAGLMDWFITIYTLDENGDTPAGPWYNRRLQLRPWQYVDASGYNAGGWNTWYVGDMPGNTNGVPEIEVNVEEYTAGGTDNGTYSLADIKTNFGSDQLWFIALGTSFNNESGWGPGEFSSYVDNLQFDLSQTNGPVALNLETPEPAGMAVWSLLALCGAGHLWRRRTRA